jgi:hypothetical protein
MARMPGAVWRPIPVAASRAKRSKGRGVIFHVAVSESKSLFGYFSTASSDSHFYVAKDGTIEQYVDTDLVAYANGAANATMISVETQGGMANADVEPWTEPQLVSCARVAAWANEIDGCPLQVMPNSLASSKGIGWHKLGVRPYVVAGGEVWSATYGKICPGKGKIAQIQDVVLRAQRLRGMVGAPVIVPPTPTLPPVVLRPAMLPQWKLPNGHYYGNLNGPASSHGGYFSSEKPIIKLIQQWFVYKNCVPGIPSIAWSTTGWADGRWEDATDAACVLWHNKYYTGQPYPKQLWSDDYYRLDD